MIAAIWGVMAATPWHTYQVLTKRIREGAGSFTLVERGAWSPPSKPSCRPPSTTAGSSGIPRGSESPSLPSWHSPCRRHEPPAGRLCGPLSNVWLGASVESQEYAEQAGSLHFGMPGGG